MRGRFPIAVCIEERIAPISGNLFAVWIIINRLVVVAETSAYRGNDCWAGYFCSLAIKIFGELPNCDLNFD